MGGELSFARAPIPASERRRYLDHAHQYVVAERSLQEIFSGVSDRHWYWALTEGRRECDPLAQKLPILPSEETQANYTGLSGDAGMEQAVLASSWMRKEAAALGLSFGDPQQQLLDFGCGWGRLTQVFLRDFMTANIVGCDVSAEALELFRKTNLGCHLIQVKARPPLALPDDTIDFVTAYSVFSHLSEEVHWAWVQELHRVLRPGGVLAVTTRPREFIDHVVHLRQQEDIPDFARGAASSFVDAQASYAKYDAGQFCFDVMGAGGGGRQGFYGEALIPEAYLERVWGALFTTTGFVSHLEHRSFDQNLLLAQK